MASSPDSQNAPLPEGQLRVVRFGDYLRAINLSMHEVRYSELPAPAASAKVSLRPIDTFRIVSPFFFVRAREQMRAVIPLGLYLVAFQWGVLKLPIANAGTIGLGFVGVMMGLLLFMEGVKIGLMPFGEGLGHALPRKLGLFWVLFIAFLLGMGVTFAEPAIGALQLAGSLVSSEKDPYLASVLGERSGWLVLLVAMGVGLATALGVLRSLYGWGLKPLILTALVPALGLTLYCAAHPALVSMIGLAWDCGGVTTGPVTVPLVLALGLGVASAAGRGGQTLSGFGVVTLASLFPVVGALALGVGLSVVHSPAEVSAGVQAAAQKMAAFSSGHGFWSVSPGAEILSSIQAVVPLVLFLLLVLYGILREKLRSLPEISLGIAFTLLGMGLFNLGLRYGLSDLGDQAGGFIPGAFTPLSLVPGSPLFERTVGIGIAGVFAWVLGFGATLAEPALNAMGITVENLTQGVLKRRSLVLLIAGGVATGILLGFLKVIFGFSTLWLLLPPYALALVLTFFASEEIANVAWDGAGVTTGPVTVPLVLALGLGIGRALGRSESFGILAAASVMPIVFVLAHGVWSEAWARRQSRALAVEERGTLG
jgi:hypothetical protein